MHITLETDYAIRIVDCLARKGVRMGAKEISEKASVTLRFSLKILRKLVASGIARSFKGAKGGYELARPPKEISIHDILVTIEGPYRLNRCMTKEFECTRVPGKNCPYHCFFADLSLRIQKQLSEVSIADLCTSVENCRE